MKSIILSFILFTCITSMLNAKTFPYLDSVKIEIDSFVKKVKPLSIGNGKYNVYVVTVKQESDYSFTLSINYICNEGRIYETKANSYFELNGEFVLFDVSKEYQAMYKNYFNLQLLDSNALSFVKKKLVPTINGGITGRFKGLLFDYKEGKILKEFFNDAEEMPEEFQIVKWPEGTMIERFTVPK